MSTKLNKILKVFNKAKNDLINLEIAIERETDEIVKEQEHLEKCKAELHKDAAKTKTVISNLNKLLGEG